MHMTLETDYAVRIVEALTREGKAGGRPDHCGTHPGAPAVCTERSCGSLVADGIWCVPIRGLPAAMSWPGAPGEITLREVIESVEGPYRMSRCQGR